MRELLCRLSTTNGARQSGSIGGGPCPTGVDRPFAKTADDQNHAGDECQRDHHQWKGLAALASRVR